MPSPSVSTMCAKPAASLQAVLEKGMLQIGISGWSYKPWRGVFYPEKLKIADQLQFASRTFSTIEVNGSFYSLQRPETCRAWYRATPENFVFSLKGGRYITHLKRLKNAEQGLANFFASGVLELGDKLGPILWQLPPALRFDPQRLSEFFELLPGTFQEAARLAKRHGELLNGRASFGPGGRARLRYALEFRHPSFVCPEAMSLLRRHQIAVCIADSAGLFPCVEDLTSDFVYVRLHGSEQLYTSGYTIPELVDWAKRIQAWRKGKAAARPRLADQASRGDGKPHDVFVYFDNDVKAHAPFDALNLRRILAGEEPVSTPSVVRTVSEEPRTSWPAWARPVAS